MPPGFGWLIAAQAVSALADNALLVVAIALLDERGLPGWWAPLLKFGFTLAYVVLAPLLGPLADAVPKARLMAAMTAVKMLGVAALALGAHPVAAFAVVGVAAAAYAPAKYGLVTEIVPAPRLVAANGHLEGSVVLAVLFGTGLGGALVAAPLRHGALAQAFVAALPGAGSLGLPLALLLCAYAASGALNAGVPAGGACRAAARVGLARDFVHANATLWRDRDGALSLAVTTVFWGVGATLQFAVLRWATEVMALTLAQAAWLQAAVAVGVVAGASLAGRAFVLSRARRALPAGIAFGLLVPAVASAPTLALALPLLVLVGAFGGMLVVPLNALLQHRGHALLSAGRSIAVQGFNENLGVLLMLAAYAALLAQGVAIVPLLWGLGIGVAALVGALVWRERRR